MWFLSITRKSFSFHKPITNLSGANSETSVMSFYSRTVSPLLAISTGLPDWWSLANLQKTIPADVPSAKSFLVVLTTLEIFFSQTLYSLFFLRICYPLFLSRPISKIATTPEVCPQTSMFLLAPRLKLLTLPCTSCELIMSKVVVLTA